MRRTTTEGPAHRPVRLRWLLLRWGVGVSILLALIVLFEVGIRHVPPDGMTVTYDYKYSANAVIGTRTYTAPKDQQTIHDAYTAFNAAPVVLVAAGDFAGCSLRPDPSQVVFTWHGILVESWTSVGCANVESAGGISDELDIDEHLVLHLLPDITMPLPPPRAG